MGGVQIFISAVSSEFEPYREQLRRELSLPGVTLKIQEEFVPTGTETLDKLDLYIRQCDAVVHLVGDMTGSLAKPSSVTSIRNRYPDLAKRLPGVAMALVPGGEQLPYTQWEAWLALYHEKVLLIAKPGPGAKRGPRYCLLEEQSARQQTHLARLAAEGRHAEIVFADSDNLTIRLLAGLQGLLARIDPPVPAWQRGVEEISGRAATAMRRLVRPFVVAAIAALLILGLLRIGLPLLAADFPVAVAGTAIFVGALVALFLEGLLRLLRLRTSNRGRAP